MAEKASADDNITADRLAEELEQIQQRLVKRRAQCQALLREVKLARAAANDSSWELADVEQRLRELAEQREGPGDPLLEREIVHLTRQCAQLEERVLTQLLQVDELIERAQVEELALASAQHDWTVRAAELRAERDRLDEGRPMVDE
jgi:predicted  nucleic acid-binding Zn-ribbon protein